MTIRWNDQEEIVCLCISDGKGVVISVRKEVKLYNVLFPLWLLLILPISWIVVLPANYIIDTIVLLITLKLLKQNDILNNYYKVIIKVWVFGFLSDFIGAGFMLLTTIGSGDWWYYYIQNPVSYNPFDNLYSLFYVLIVIAIVAVSIYFFNLKYSLKKMETDITTKKQIALSLAIFTAPYILLFPSQLLYK